MRSRLLLAAQFALFICPVFGAVVVQVVPASQNATLGATVSVQVAISGLGVNSPPSLGAYDLNIGFDPTILQFTNSAYGDPTLGDQLNLAGLGSIQSTTPGNGTVEVFELSLDSINDLNNLQAPAFVLVTLTFQALKTGTSPMSVTINALSDAFGNGLGATTAGGSVSVSQSPILTPVLSTPALVAFALLLAALGAAVMRTRTKDAIRTGSKI